MSSDPAVVELHDVGKRFRRGPNAPATLKDLAVSRGRRRGRNSGFWALRGVTHALQRGRSVGLIGQNGAGKSTLLRLMGGIGRPDEGKVVVRGRIGALLELGKEFHPELTGRENAVLSAVVAGMTRRQARAVLPEIAAFAELEAFLDNPLRTYSTGMQARLAFASAVHIEPEVLLVDEVLAVGDLMFQRRCIDRMHAFKAAGVTLVLVSHDLGLVRQLCDEAIWLRRGAIAAAGPTDDVLRTYAQTMSLETESVTPSGPDIATEAGTTLRFGTNRFGSQAARIERVRILDGFGRTVSDVVSGGELRVEMRVSIDAEVGRCRLAVKVRRHDEVLCLDTSTPVDPPGATSVLTIARLDLAPGRYAVDVGIFSSDWEQTHDLHVGAYPIVVGGGAEHVALLAPPASWSTRS